MRLIRVAMIMTAFASGCNSESHRYSVYSNGGVYETSVPSCSSRDGSYLFSSPLDGKGDIIVWHPLKQKYETLVGTVATEYSPVYSHDGLKVAFGRERTGGEGNVWILDIQSKQERQVTKGHAMDDPISFSSTGEELLIKRSRGTGGLAKQVDFVCVDTRTQQETACGWDAAFDHEGTTVYFTEDGAGDGVYQRRINSIKIRERICDGSAFVPLHEQGQLLVWSSGSGWNICDGNSGGIRPVAALQDAFLVAVSKNWVAAVPSSCTEVFLLDLNALDATSIHLRGGPQSGRIEGIIKCNDGFLVRFIDASNRVGNVYRIDPSSKRMELLFSMMSR